MGSDNVSAYCLHIAEDDGEVDTDFPPLDSNEPIHKFGFSTLALVEKYSSPGLTSKESLFVRINAAHGFSLIQVDNTKVTMKEILLKAVKRRKGSQRISAVTSLLLHVGVAEMLLRNGSISVPASHRHSLEEADLK
ncbi:hypothetical protein U0070_015545 [Myodes glareolus]|uniref:Uncharacterized protein n=1 Tax=Myodes glareolus TaxID=447135 RepID=A0AAW0HIM2_MYOGA